MKKKMIMLLLALSLSAAAIACGGSEETAVEDSTETTTDDIEDAVEEADEAIQDAAEQADTDVTTVDEATEAMEEVAKGGGPATMDKYTQLENGMTYDEVKEIMGEDGVESVAAENDATNIQIYQWAGETPGSNVTVTFQDGAATTFAQVGLE